MFSIAVESISYLAGQISVFAAKHGSIHFHNYCCFDDYCYMSSEGQL